MIIINKIEVAEPRRLCPNTSLVQQLKLNRSSLTTVYTVQPYLTIHYFAPRNNIFWHFVPFLQSTAGSGLVLNDVASCASSDFVHSSIVYYREYREWEGPNVWLKHVFLHYNGLQTDYHKFKPREYNIYSRGKITDDPTPWIYYWRNNSSSLYQSSSA